MRSKKKKTREGYGCPKFSSGEFSEKLRRSGKRMLGPGWSGIVKTQFFGNFPRRKLLQLGKGKWGSGFFVKYTRVSQSARETGRDESRKCSLPRKRFKTRDEGSSHFWAISSKLSATLRGIHTYLPTLAFRPLLLGNREWGCSRRGVFRNSWRVGSPCKEICYCKGILTRNWHLACCCDVGFEDKSTIARTPTFENPPFDFPELQPTKPRRIKILGAFLGKSIFQEFWRVIIRSFEKGLAGRGGWSEEILPMPAAWFLVSPKQASQHSSFCTTHRLSVGDPGMGGAQLRGTATCLSHKTILRLFLRTMVSCFYSHCALMTFHGSRIDR